MASDAGFQNIFARLKPRFLTCAKLLKFKKLETDNFWVAVKICRIKYFTL